jgi:hypothetical protein
MKSPWFASFLLVTGLLLAPGSPASAASAPTAFQLIQDGARFVGEPSKGKVLEISSEKSIASLTPSLWTISYFDPDAVSKVVKVKFGAGLKLDVSRPWRPFNSARESDVLNISKFKVDSDEAIKLATSQALLAPFTLKATQLRLAPSADGIVWQVRIWAAKLGKPDVVMDIGKIYLSPVDGKVVRADLHIERLN